MHLVLPGIVLFCLLSLPKVPAIFRLEDERSSFVSFKHDTCLKQHVIQSKKTTSFSKCVQYCMADSKCKSVNYKKIGVCELNDASPEDGHVHDHVVSKGEVLLAWWISYIQEKYVFTSLNGKGRNGPTSTANYNQTNLRGSVQLINAIQYWETPDSGNYIIEALGASGSNGTCSASGCTGWSLGGKGAKMTGSFPLKKGTRLKILVGQQGKCDLGTPDSPGGGGGGTFVSLADNTPLIVAGGGGGGGITSSGPLDGDPGQTSTNGSRYGGTDGSGGLRYDPVTKTTSPMFPRPNDFFGEAGAGFYKDGDSLGGSKAQSYVDGGTGGLGNSEGGFGGGGFGLGKSPGGGGGYSGGGLIINSNTGGTAGGGGSFNGGSDQINESGVNTGDGRVIIILSK